MGSNMDTPTYMYFLVPCGKECVHKEGAESPGLVAEVIVFSFTLHRAFDVFTAHLLIVECLQCTCNVLFSFLPSHAYHP